MLRKSTSLLLSALSVALYTTITYADGASTNQFVTLSKLQPGFKYSLAVLGLKPAASNLNYVIFNKELPAQSPNWEEKEIRPGYAAAFELGVGYNFDENKDISLTWTHLDSKTSDFTEAPDASYFLGPDYEIGPDAIPIRSALGKAQFKYDVINLDIGQSVNWGQSVGTRFFVGLSNAYLREQVNATYYGSVTTGPYQGPFSTLQKVTADFTGLGPRLGLEANYNANSQFSFFGEGAASLLIGFARSKTNYISTSQALIALFDQTYNYQSIKDQNVTQVIPGFDGKIGATYQHQFSKGILLTVDAGYQAAVYINAISQYLPGSLVEPMETGGIYVATMDHTLSNYSVQGPFLKATIQL